MTDPRLRMRQVHLDFHTPGSIPDVGKDFDPEAFAATAKAAYVDSMTVFSRCHHGYSYHPTDVGTMHPGLSFDLLGAQVDALHQAGIRAPVYMTVGWDELSADAHPDWVQVDRQGQIAYQRPGDRSSWRWLDFASPYVDYVLACTEEVLQRYGPVDGLFFDIIRQAYDGNFSTWRRQRMAHEGIDPNDEPAVQTLARRLEREVMERAHDLVRRYSGEATIFFKQPAASRLRDPEASSRGEMPWFLPHIEIESLPSVQWGYNHYPLFAAYYQTLGKPLLGMTGIFHKSWADFGGCEAGGGAAL